MEGHYKQLLLGVDVGLVASSLVEVDTVDGGRWVVLSPFMLGHCARFLWATKQAAADL